MNTAKPMWHFVRYAIYTDHGREALTPRQRRRIQHKANRWMQRLRREGLS